MGQDCPIGGANRYSRRARAAARRTARREHEARTSIGAYGSGMSSRLGREQIEFLAREYLRTSRLLERHHHHLEDPVSHALVELRQVLEVLEFINMTGRDPYVTLANVDELLREIERALKSTRRVLDASGFLQLEDDKFELLMEAVSSEDLPPEEASLLELYGFSQLAEDVEAITDLVRTEWKFENSPMRQVTREYSRAPISGALENAIADISRHRDELRESGKDESETAQPKKKRKWWKGIGQIAQGSAMAILDVGIAVGTIAFPVSPSTQTYGAVVSVTAGCGRIMSGVGDLWGE